MLVIYVMYDLIERTMMYMMWVLDFVWCEFIP